MLLLNERPEPWTRVRGPRAQVLGQGSGRRGIRDGPHGFLGKGCQQRQQRGGRLFVTQVPAAGQHAEAAVLQAPAQRRRALRRHHPARPHCSELRIRVLNPKPGT